MKHSTLPIVVCAAAMCGFMEDAPTIDICRTGYEPFPSEIPGFILGNIHGQNGWLLTPQDAQGFIQDSRSALGIQALQLIDGATHSQAKLNMNTSLTMPQLSARFDMFITEAWADGIGEDRYEAQGCLKLLDENNKEWGLEFGALKVGSEKYMGLTPGSTAYFIELTMGDTVMDGVYLPMDYFLVAGEWHRYKLCFNKMKNGAELYIDRELVLEMPVFVNFASVSNIQLQNQRWDSGPNNTRSIYFDTLRTVDTVGDLFVIPEHFNRVRGLPVAGVLEDLYDSDDSRVVTRPDVFNPSNIPPVQMEITTTSPLSAPSKMTLVIESDVSVNNIMQRVLMYNYNMMEYETVEVHIGDMSDDVTDIVIEGDAYRFIHPQTGQIKVLIQHNGIAFNIIPTWAVGLDQVIWFLEE